MNKAGQDICFMPSTALAAAIRAKSLSPVELVRAVYERLHETNDRMNAFCTLSENEAVNAAKEAEAAVMRRDPLGVLPGIPVSIKDLFLTRGVRTMFGSRIRETTLGGSEHLEIRFLPLAPPIVDKAKELAGPLARNAANVEAQRHQLTLCRGFRCLTHCSDDGEPHGADNTVASKSRGDSGTS